MEAARAHTSYLLVFGANRKKRTSARSGPGSRRFAVIAVRFIEHQLTARRHLAPTALSTPEFAPIRFAGDFALERKKKEG